MYSVIIQNRKTMDSFNIHYPLFLDALDKGGIGVCRWNEAGSTIDTAVPELVELTNDKKEWRAIIVHIENESDMSEFPGAARNPFDFLVNGADDCRTKESPVPFIKLAYLLGGVPTPKKRFEETVVDEKIPPKVVYAPVDDSEERELYEQLSEKYSFDGKRPSEIVMIMLRGQLSDVETKSKKAWSNFYEDTSSNFWERNHYPSICRFLVFDTTKQGAIERAADMFRFWTSVMMLALNEVEPDFIQAYRLYKLQTVIDTDVLRAAFQQTVNRLAGAQATIAENIRIETQRRLNESSKLPDYDKEIPVTFDFSTKPIKKAKAMRFGLAAKSVGAELRSWEELREASEMELKAAFHATDRALEQSAERLHSEAAYPDIAIRRLDKYEVLDFEQKLEDTYSEVMDILGELPREPLYKNSDVAGASDRVRESILSRMTVAQAAAGAGIAAGLLCLSFIPAAIRLNEETNGSAWTIFGGVVIGVGLISAGAAVLLQYKRRKLTREINDYTGKLRRILAALTVSARDYSRYLSGIAEHIRGSVYLKLFHKKNFNENRLLEARKAHIRAAQALINKLMSWSVAFHIQVNFEEDAIEDNVIIDPLCPPGRNPLYTFECGADYERPLNISGDHVISPFEFVSQLKIDREELYNDE